MIHFPKCEGKGSFQKSQIKSLFLTTKESGAKRRFGTSIMPPPPTLVGASHWLWRPRLWVMCVIIYLDSGAHHYVLTTTESWQHFDQ